MRGVRRVTEDPMDPMTTDHRRGTLPGAGGVALLAVGLLLLPALAGCLGGPSPDGPSADGADAAGFGLDTIPEPPGADGAGPDDWFLVETEAGPEGRVTAFAWRVPPGTVAVEAVPLLPDRGGGDGGGGDGGSDGDDGAPAPIHWGILKFRISLGQAVLSGGYLSPTVEATTRTLTGEPLRETVEAPVAPFRMPMAAVPGEVVALLLASRSPEDTRFAIAFRPVTEPELTDPLVGDRAAFLDRVGDRPGRRLTPLDTTTGFDVPAYVEVNTPDGGRISQTDAVRVQEHMPDPVQDLDPRPLATVRDVALTSDFETDAGWGLVVGGYAPSVGTGRWSVDATMHDHAAEAAGLLVPSAVGGDDQVFGTPVFLVTGEGPGESHVEFRVATANANVQETVALLQIEVGQTLTELFGFQGLALTESFDGAAAVDPLDPPVREGDGEGAGAGMAQWGFAVEGGDLVLEGPDGARLVVAGMVR